jgi:hypothetical protein
MIGYVKDLVEHKIQYICVYQTARRAAAQMHD